MKTILAYKLTLLGIGIGAVGGYLYYHFIGCNTGSCPITSQPINSTIYGALMGGLMFNSFKKQEPKQNQNETKA